jgi:hypothetical protein
MKTMLTSIALSLLAATLWAGPIDGKWQAETKLEGKSKRAGTTVTTTFDLKTADGKLTGSVSTGRGKRNKTAEIQNGKIEGDRFSFTTIQKTRNGEKTISWQGTLSGNELKGTTGRGKRSVEFTAKKVS